MNWHWLGFSRNLIAIQFSYLVLILTIFKRNKREKSFITIYSVNYMLRMMRIQNKRGDYLLTAH